MRNNRSYCKNVDRNMEIKTFCNQPNKREGGMFKANVTVVKITFALIDTGATCPLLDYNLFLELKHYHPSAKLDIVGSENVCITTVDGKCINIKRLFSANVFNIFNYCLIRCKEFSVLFSLKSNYSETF